MILSGWGANTYGQLGITGSYDDSHSPHPISLNDQPLDDIQRWTGGGNHALILLRNGNLLSCGLNKNIECLLPPTIEQSSTYIQVHARLNQQGVKFRDIACGWSHSLIITEPHGLAFFIGNSPFIPSFNNPLSIPSLSSLSINESHWPPISIPTQEDQRISTNWIRAASGPRHCLLQHISGRWMGFGWSRYGALTGLQTRSLPPPPSSLSCSPVWLPPFHQHQHHCRKGSGALVVSDVCAGWSFTAALSDEGLVLVLGTLKYVDGCVANGQWNVVWEGVARKLSAGWHHLCWLDSEGRVWCVGRNDYGQCGIPGECYSSGVKKPQMVEFMGLLMEGEYIVDIQCGSEHTLTLSNKKRVFAWGWSDHGMLGLGDTQNRHQPTLIPFKSPVELIACGYGFSLAQLATVSQE